MSNNSVTSAYRVEEPREMRKTSNKSVTSAYRMEKAKKMSLLGKQCLVCGEIDPFKIHRSIDDCIAFVDSEILTFENEKTLLISPLHPVFVARLKWVRGVLVSVKEGKQKILLQTSEGKVEYQYPNAETMLSSANQGDNTKRSCQ